jgi:hypothetical protein
MRCVLEEIAVFRTLFWRLEFKKIKYYAIGANSLFKQSYET